MTEPTNSGSKPEKLSLGIHSAWEAIRDLLNITGYVLIGCLVVYALLKPAGIKTYLQRLGLKDFKATAGPFEANFDVTDTANSFTQLSEKIAALQKQISEIVATVQNPETKAKIQSVAQEAVVLHQDVTNADESLRNALAKKTQQAESSQSDTPLTGWIFLGRTDNSQQHWDTTSQTVPMPIPTSIGPGFKPGDEITLQSSAYLRGDGPEYAITKHPVIGAVPAGARVRFLEPRFNNIRSGGKYLWAKVEYTL